MKIVSGFVIRSVGGENVAVPVGEKSKQFRGMITLNDTAAFLWRYFMEERTLEEGISAMCAQYDVDEEKARNDVEKFIKNLTDNGLIES